MDQDHVMRDGDLPDGVEIHEAGLLLRPFQEADADAVYRACQDPRIQRWTNVPVPYRREHAASFVTSFTEQSWASGSAAPLGVFDAATGDLLGSCGLVKILPLEAAAEIGYWTAPWARGRGVATGAARAVARWTLASLNLGRVLWRAEVGNHASRLVAIRIGVHMEGLLRGDVRRRGGETADAWVGSLRPGELTEAETAPDESATALATTFLRPQPHLTTRTRRGTTTTLRPLTPADLDGIVAACSDPETVRWTTVPTPYRRRDAESFVDEFAPNRWLRGEAAIFAITGPDHMYAGSIELRLIRPRVGDIGFLMAPWARGKGYATAAVRALCGWGFETLRLERIEWVAFVGNEASRRVIQRAGFTVEGLARARYAQRGERRDTWTGAILATDPAPPD
jgi:RimJ/RimL family protein N-acetyltransferase